MHTDYSKLYKDQLLEKVIPFWEKHSIDNVHGGYFSCLNKKGEVYDTDKFVWLQARQIWTFSMLYDKVEQKESWKKIAEGGIEFLRKHGRDENGSFYFSLSRDGQPLTKAFNIYADCFAAVAFGAYANTFDDAESLAIAKNTFQLFLDRRANPKGQLEKSTGIRPMKTFGLPMMTAWLTRELSFLVSQEEQTAMIDNCIHQIFDVHYNPKTGMVHEMVSPEGEFLDTYEGRLLNPGHSIEAMWFIMDIAEDLDRPELIEKATDLCLRILDYGWDKEYGGIFYFLDAKGAPLQQLEWDQKLWWVHQEALIALSKAYRHTGRKDVWEWYEKVHNYAWTHFPDDEHGEWYGYLNRQGTPHSTLKGGKWKGCFHTPRTMFECWQTFEKISKSNVG